VEVIEMNKALIIDDDDTIRAILKRVLINKFGIIPFEANNGKEGLNILKNNLPDVILLDNTMPVMDGVSFLRNIRNEEKYKDIPVLVITANDESEIVEEMIQLGITDYILKPIDPEVTFQRIKTAIDRMKNKK
jgi:two-component system, chemotaxis family, chemotaxis protein CheY